MEGVVKFIGLVEKVEGDTVKIRIFREYCEGLKGIEEYSHLIILYWIHLRTLMSTGGRCLFIRKGML